MHLFETRMMWKGRTGFPMDVAIVCQTLTDESPNTAKEVQIWAISY